MLWELHSRDLIRLTYEGTWIVFQRSAGKTHFLNETSARILDALEKSALSVPELGSLLTGKPADRVPRDDLRYLDAHLERLNALGLTRRCDAATTE